MLKTSATWLCVLALTLFAAACDDGESTTTTPTPTPDGSTTADAGGDAAAADAGPETSASPTFANDIAAILGAKCAGCHTGGAGSGGHNIGDTASDAAKNAGNPSCSGLTVAECSILRIKDGSMPLGAGCSGDPATDAGNAACLTADEQALVQAWVDAGAPE